jgi:hypothetical protein
VSLLWQFSAPGAPTEADFSGNVSIEKLQLRSGDVNVTAFDVVNELTDERPIKKKKLKPTRKTARKTSAS